MTLLTVRLRGIRRKYLVKTWGYIDLEEEHRNIVYLEWRLFDRLVIWRETVFSEPVPFWAVLKYSTLGFSEWRSKKPWLIDACAVKRCIKRITL